MTTAIRFWNGNKTPARQAFETELLGACLAVTQDSYGSVELQIDNTDYALAEDEGNVFNRGTDILVTVAGNVKFTHKAKIVINQPLCKGLLGHRLLIIKQAQRETFAKLTSSEQLQSLSIGIPETWADAELFRCNNYKVTEKGSFERLFNLLKGGEFDYVALGVNEIEQTFEQRVASLGGMCIEPNILLYYPFPLVFYVNPSKAALAQRVAEGLAKLIACGQFEQMFNARYGRLLAHFKLASRKVFRLQNPRLPAEMADKTPTLLD